MANTRILVQLIPALVLTAVAGCSAGTPRATCDEFETQPEAQAAVEAGEVRISDPDEDGVYCEGLPIGDGGEDSAASTTAATTTTTASTTAATTDDIEAADKAKGAEFVARVEAAATCAEIDQIEAEYRDYRAANEYPRAVLVDIDVDTAILSRFSSLGCFSSDADTEVVSASGGPAGSYATVADLAAALTAGGYACTPPAQVASYDNPARGQGECTEGGTVVIVYSNPGDALDNATSNAGVSADLLDEPVLFVQAANWAVRCPELGACERAAAAVGGTVYEVTPTG